MAEIVENKEVIKNEEISLSEVLKKIRIGRKIIYKSVAIFFVLGLIIALGTPKEYKCEVTLLVELDLKSGGMSGLLQQFGGLAGMNLGGSGGFDALNPQLYPDVVKSSPFLLEIMKKKVTESKYDSTLTVAQYLDRHTKSSLLSIVMGYTIGLPGKIIGLFKRSNKSHQQVTVNSQEPRFLKLTQEQSNAISELSGIIKLKKGETNNILLISVEVQDPVVAAQLTDSVVKSLTHYVIDYRTQKSKFDLKFISDRLEEAKDRYVQAQQALAEYTDRNKNVILASARTEEQRLQSEYNLTYNIYNTLLQQLEQSKIKVQESTPVFTVINPAMVPLEKSKPNNSLILMIMVLLGGFIGAGVIFGKMVYLNLKLN